MKSVRMIREGAMAILRLSSRIDNDEGYGQLGRTAHQFAGHDATELDSDKFLIVNTLKHTDLVINTTIFRAVPFVLPFFGSIFRALF